MKLSSNWYPTMTGYSDQTGVSHLIDDESDPVRLACGRTYRYLYLGNGAPTPEELGTTPCRTCLRMQAAAMKKEMK